MASASKFSICISCSSKCYQNIVRGPVCETERHRGIKFGVLLYRYYRSFIFANFYNKSVTRALFMCVNTIISPERNILEGETIWYMTSASTLKFGINFWTPSVCSSLTAICVFWHFFSRIFKVYADLHGHLTTLIYDHAKK